MNTHLSPPIQNDPRGFRHSPKPERGTASQPLHGDPHVRNLSDPFINSSIGSRAGQWQNQHENPSMPYNSSNTRDSNRHNKSGYGNGYPNNAKEDYRASQYNGRIPFHSDTSMRGYHDHKHPHIYHSSPLNPHCYNFPATHHPPPPRSPFVGFGPRPSTLHDSYSHPDSAQGNQQPFNGFPIEQKKRHRRLFSGESLSVSSPQKLQRHHEQYHRYQENHQHDPRRYHQQKSQSQPNVPPSNTSPSFGGKVSLHHKRTSSAGLDILSLAVDVSKQELAAAVDKPLVGGHHKRNSSISTFLDSGVSNMYQHHNSLVSVGSVNQWTEHQNHTHKRMGSNLSIISAISTSSDHQHAQNGQQMANTRPPKTLEISIMPPPRAPMQYQPPPLLSPHSSKHNYNNPGYQTEMDFRKSHFSGHHHYQNHPNPNNEQLMTIPLQPTVPHGNTSLGGIGGVGVEDDSHSLEDEKLETTEKLFSNKEKVAILNDNSPSETNENRHPSESDIFNHRVTTSSNNNINRNASIYDEGNKNNREQPTSPPLPRPPTPQPTHVLSPSNAFMNKKGNYSKDILSLNSSSKDAASTSKKFRRKCSVESCPNRVVQGGRCISHGAKRKICSEPGCNKNVKKAGLCSAHGPARKRCEVEGCQKVCVQGGRCIAHGARKKLCKIDGCSKQAILSGMCKKHHDKYVGVAKRQKGEQWEMTGGNNDTKTDSLLYFNNEGKSICLETTDSKARKNSEKGDTFTASLSSSVNCSKSKPASGKNHKRGLSVFHDLNAVDIIIQNDSNSSDIVPLSQNSSALKKKNNLSSSPSGRALDDASLSLVQSELQNKPIMNNHHHKPELSVFDDFDAVETTIHDEPIRKSDVSLATEENKDRIRSSTVQYNSSQQRNKPGEKKNHHKRGLSVFDDLNGFDSIMHDDSNLKDSNISTPKIKESCSSPKLNSSLAMQGSKNNDQNRKRMEKPTHQRGLSIFVDNDVAESIIKKNIII